MSWRSIARGRPLEDVARAVTPPDSISAALIASVAGIWLSYFFNAASGGTIVYGENCRNLRPHLLEYNRTRAIASLFVRDQIGIGNESVAAAGQRFDFQFGGYEFRVLEMSLLGTFQFNNAAIAVALFLLWLQRVRPGEAAAKIEAAVRSGLRDTGWPGRLEIIKQAPLPIVDVGHTPDGIRQSLASLKAIYGREGWILVVGVSIDKKTDEIVGALAPSFDTIICTAAHHKGADAETIAAAVRKANPNATVHIAATIEDAVDLSGTSRSTGCEDVGGPAEVAGAKAVIDMQEELRNQALKLFSGFPFPNAPGEGAEEAKPRAKGAKGAARKPRSRK